MKAVNTFVSLSVADVVPSSFFLFFFFALPVVQKERERERETFYIWKTNEIGSLKGSRIASLLPSDVGTAFDVFETR